MGWGCLVGVFLIICILQVKSALLLLTLDFLSSLKTGSVGFNNTLYAGGSPCVCLSF